MNILKNMFSAWQEVTSGERNQVVFEHLNKNYGAYEIRTNYDRTLVRSLFSVVLISLLISAYCFYTSFINPIVIIPFIPAIQVDVPHITPPVAPLIHPPVTPPGGFKTNAITAPIVVDSILKIDSVPFVPVTINIALGNSKDSSNTGMGEPKILTGGTNLVDSTYTGDFLDTPPTFPGGDKALFGFLQKHISYPESVKEMHGKGVVAVGFVLDREGNVTEVTALKASKYSELNQEAIRVIQKLPKWNPGKQQGHAVKARMIIPIRFELKQ